MSGCWVASLHWTTSDIPSRELTYPPEMAYLKMIFLFPQVGYVNFLEGNISDKFLFFGGGVFTFVDSSC